MKKRYGRKGNTTVYICAAANPFHRGYGETGATTKVMDI